MIIPHIAFSEFKSSVTQLYDITIHQASKNRCTQIRTPTIYISILFSATAVFVKRRVAGIVILAVKLICHETKPFTETLVMDYFACTKEFDNVAYIGVIGKTENIIIGLSRLRP